MSTEEEKEEDKHAHTSRTRSRSLLFLPSFPWTISCFTFWINPNVSGNVCPPTVPAAAGCHRIIFTSPCREGWANASNEKIFNEFARKSRYIEEGSGRDQEGPKICVALMTLNEQRATIALATTICKKRRESTG